MSETMIEVLHGIDLSIHRRGRVHIHGADLYAICRKEQAQFRNREIGYVFQNFHLLPEAYVHRIGRTARAGAEGRAVSFCSEEEFKFLREIEKVIKMPIPRWDDHDWHVEALAEHHAAWKPGGRSGPKPGNGNRRSGGGRRRGGRGRR